MEQVLNYNAYYKHKEQPKISVDNTMPIIKNATYFQDQTDPRGIVKMSGYHIITEHVHPETQTPKLHIGTHYEHAPKEKGTNLTVNLFKYDRSKDSVNNILM